jgi:hypothetical protein
MKRPSRDLNPNRNLERAFTARTTSKVLLAGLCITVLLAALSPITIAFEITLSLVVYLGKLYFVTASDAYDVATQEPNQTARRLRIDDASKKQENESNHFSSRHIYEIATPD